MSRRMLTLTVCSALLLAAAMPAAANADSRFAEPGGNGPQSNCPQSNPCSIVDAIEGSGVSAGDKIILAGGTYTLANSESLEPPVPVNIIGPGYRKRRAHIVATRSSFGALDVFLFTSATDGSSVRDIKVSTSFPGSNPWAIRIEGADVTLTRVTAISAQGSALLLSSSGGGLSVVRDSLLIGAHEANGTLVTGGPVNAAQIIQNATVINKSPGASSAALLSLGDFGTTQATVNNSILQSAGGPDIRADNSGSNVVSITASHTNYRTAVVTGTATFTNAGGNQSDLPRYVNATGGDYRQRAGSPTINAGVATVFMGQLDFLGEPRSLGGRPDIGADEFPGLCNGRLPTIVGSNGGNLIYGTGRADVILGLGGGDTIISRAGRDRVCGGKGADALIGGAGRDRLYGQKGPDNLVGGPGRDVLRGGPGRDTITQ